LLIVGLTIDLSGQSDDKKNKYLDKKKPLLGGFSMLF